MSTRHQKSRSAYDAFAHLAESIRPLLERSDTERIKHIYTDCFIENVNSRQVHRVTEFLFNMPRRVRMPGLVIAADSGMGKTHILRQITRRHAAMSGPKPSDRQIPALYCQVPPGPTLSTFQQAFLHALGAPPVEFTRMSARNGIIVDSLREAKTHIVLIDEAQHFLTVRHRERKHLYDWMKYLSTESRLPIVLAGIRGCEVPFRTEPQLSTRFRIHEIQRWSVGPPLAQFLHTYEQICPLRRASALSQPAMMKAIARESEGVTDLMMHSLSYAAFIAIKEGIEKITPDLLSLWRDPAFVPHLEEGGSHDARN